MHKLSRQVRFSVSPFLPLQPQGFNSYASKPTGDGLAVYFSLWVELEGNVDPETGFIVNVSQIDQLIRDCFIPFFSDRIQHSFQERKSLSVKELALLVRSQGQSLSDLFAEKHQKRLKQLRLELNPYRSIVIDPSEKGSSMFTYTETFEFSAMHKLWNDKFSSENNLEVFGKCANPAGHGHNYILEVAIRVPDKLSQGAADKELNGWIADFQETVKTDFLDLVDHKNLNVDVQGFEKMNPTVENLVSFAWNKLKGRFSSSALSRITVWENDRTYCTYSEDV